MYNNDERFISHKNELQKTNIPIPIGSILSINEINEKIIIIGYNEESKNNEMFDYVGCYYINDTYNFDNVVLFNQKQINKIYSVNKNIKK